MSLDDIRLRKSPGIDEMLADNFKSAMPAHVREGVIDAIYLIVAAETHDPRVLAIRRKLFGEDIP